VADRSASSLLQKTVFVSRAREESASLCSMLESRGARVIASPLLRFALPEDLVPLDSVLKMLGEFDWWLITSQHAVEFAAARSQALGAKLTQLTRGVRVGAIGSATEKAARQIGVEVGYVAKHQSGAGLAEEIAARLAGKRVLLLRSNLADSSLPASLAREGAEVTDVIAYRTLPPDQEEKNRLTSIAWEHVDAAVFFSPSAIRHLAEALGAEKMKKVYVSTVSVAVGPSTAEAVRRQGFERCTQAEEPSSGAIASSLEEWFANRQSHKMTGVNRG
jgi:uroporphyrinogen-III synthase